MLMRANGTATPSGPRSVRKRSKAGSSVQSTTDDTMSAGCIAPQQKQTLEEALVTVVSWDSLLGTKAEEEGFKAATLAFLRYLFPSKSQRSPKESMNLPLFVRASQLCVTPPTKRGCRDLSLGSLPSPSKASAPNSSASPAIVLQQQWLAAKLKIAEAEDQSWEGRLLRGDDLIARNITPAKDLKQRGAQRAVSTDRPATVRKLHAARRLELEQPPAHKTQAVEPGTWPSEQPSSKPPWQPLKPVATHTRRAGWGLAVCLLAAALTLSAVTQARRTVVAEGGRLYGPLITAGDAAVLSAQGVLRQCKEEKRCAAAQEQLSRLTPSQRRKLGSLGGWDRYHFVGRSYRTDERSGETPGAPATGRRVRASHEPLNAVYFRY